MPGAKPGAGPAAPSDVPLADRHCREHWKNKAGLEAAARRLLEKFPDDLETLKLMLESAVERDQLDEAMSYRQRARALKPLDPALREQEATIRIGLARKCAIAGRWDEGREQFRAAEELIPDLRGQYSYLARKVLFEAKAGQRDESDRFLQEAQAALPEPTPLWLALAIESSRYQMTAATTKGYAELWTADLKKKCQSQTAGEMASAARCVSRTPTSIIRAARPDRAALALSEAHDPAEIPADRHRAGL